MWMGNPSRPQWHFNVATEWHLKLMNDSKYLNKIAWNAYLMLRWRWMAVRAHLSCCWCCCYYWSCIIAAVVIDCWLEQIPWRVQAATVADPNIAIAIPISSPTVKAAYKMAYHERKKKQGEQAWVKKEAKKEEATLRSKASVLHPWMETWAVVWLWDTVPIKTIFTLKLLVWEIPPDCNGISM